MKQVTAMFRAVPGHEPHPSGTVPQRCPALAQHARGACQAPEPAGHLYWTRVAKTPRPPRRDGLRGRAHTQKKRV